MAGFTLTDIPYDRGGINPLPVVIIGQGRLDSLLCQYGAVDFCWGKPVQRFYYRFVGQFQRVLNRFPLDHVGGNRAGGNGSTAAKGFKLHIGDGATLDFQIHLHNIAALGVSYLTDAIGIGKFAHIVGIGEVLHDFI